MNLLHEGAERDSTYQMDDLFLHTLSRYADEDDEDREQFPPGRLTVRLMSQDEVSARPSSEPLTWYRFNADGHLTRITEPDGTVLDPDDPLVALPLYMQSICRDRFKSEWETDIEYILWDEVLQLNDPSSFVFTRSETSWGYRPIRLRKLMRLAGAARGWCYRPEGSSKSRFVPLGDWLRMYDAHRAHP